MENIKKFEKLMKKIGTPEFDKLLDEFDTDNLTDKERKQMQEIFTKHWEMTKIKVDAALKRNSIKEQLQDNSEIIPFAYIAREYFRKSMTWLYQRVNGSIVNGKPCQFKDEEIVIFNNALKDVGQRIGSLSIYA